MAMFTTRRIELDPTSRCARVGEAEVGLSPREYELLEALAQHPNQVLSRDQLLSHAWGDAFETRSNVVDVYVGYLRRKLGPGVIETVRGSGYRLRAPRLRLALPQPFLEPAFFFPLGEFLPIL